MFDEIEPKTSQMFVFQVLNLLRRTLNDWIRLRWQFDGNFSISVVGIHCLHRCVVMGLKMIQIPPENAKTDWATSRMTLVP